MSDKIISDDSLFIMNEATWEDIKEREYVFANTQPDPIKYLKSLTSLNVSIDNDLQFGIIELWNKHDYEDYIREISGE